MACNAHLCDSCEPNAQPRKRQAHHWAQKVGSFLSPGYEPNTDAAFRCRRDLGQNVVLFLGPHLVWILMFLAFIRLIFFMAASFLFVFVGTRHKLVHENFAGDLVQKFWGMRFTRLPLGGMRVRP